MRNQKPERKEEDVFRWSCCVVGFLVWCFGFVAIPISRYQCVEDVEVDASQSGVEGYYCVVIWSCEFGMDGGMMLW